MNKSIFVKIKKFILPMTLLVLIALLMGISFLPNIRGGSVTASARTAQIDAEALRVLNCCRAYAAVNDFSTTLDGKIKAKVMGIPYTQNVTGRRSVSGDKFCEVAESASAFVKAAVKKQHSDEGFYVAKGDYKKKAFVYGAPQMLDRETYIATYGKPFTDIVKYELDNAIISAERLDDNTFRFILDAHKATLYSQNEVRALLGGKSFPDYESVEFTLVTDGERAVKISSCEKFRIDKLGGTHCTAQYTEIFTYSQI